jgi:hypothetical protein
MTSATPAPDQVSMAEIAGLLAWARSLSDAGPAVNPAERAAFLASRQDRPAYPHHRPACRRSIRKGRPVIEKLQGFYGFTRMQFGRDLAPGMRHRHNAHGEAVARITWCVTERRIGVITGEVGAGNTVAIRAALAALDPTRHTIIYLPNPPSEYAASTTRSSSRWAGNPWSATPPSSPKPPTPWPPNTPNEAASPC